MEEKDLKNQSNYDGNDIKELSNRDAVRQRPGMYIGGTSIDNMHHLVWEIVNNSIDEFIAGHGNDLKIKLNENGSITITDNGRGIPISKNTESGMPAIRMVFEKLHAGGKFGNKNYQVSGGLHGVGASVTNFLSKELKCIVKKGGKIYSIQYKEGYLDEDLKEIGVCGLEETGTQVTFIPDDEIFKTIDFDWEKIYKYIEYQSYLLPKITINLESFDGKKETFHGKGLPELLDNINQNKVKIIKKIIGDGTTQVISKKGKTKIEKRLDVSFVIQYLNTDEVKTTSFVNNIITKYGGSHNKGLERGVQKGIEDYIKLKKIKLTSKNENIKYNDYIKGLSSIISIYYSEPEFIGQTKEELGNEEVTKPINNIIREKFLDFMMRNPEESKKIIKKVQDNIKLRKSIENAKDGVLKKTGFFATGVIGKLKNCTGRNPKENEIFIVEGDSAGGSSNMGRNKKNQAVLALKGKVINAINSTTLNKVLQNAEVGTIINSLGCGILEDYNEEKLKYHKIIINTDMDPDGHHITALLIALFFTIMPDLIKNGHLYKGVGPLYGIEVGNKKYYIETDQEKDEFLKKIEGKKYTMYRFKGLGEMNKDQIRETMMAPETRRLKQITYSDYQEVKDYIGRIMGSDTALKFDVTKKYTMEDVI